MILICDKGKEYIDKSKRKQDTISRKMNYLLNMIAILEKQRWSYQVRNEDYNHSSILTRAYPIYRKIVQIEKVLDQIKNHTKIGILPQQTLVYHYFSQNPKNSLFKN